MEIKNLSLASAISVLKYGPTERPIWLQPAIFEYQQEYCNGQGIKGKRDSRWAEQPYNVL